MGSNADSPPEDINNNNNNTHATDWKIKKASSFPSQNEYTRRHHWAQILSKGEEITRQATDAHRREFTTVEIQRVENLALSLLSEVRKLLNEEKPLETSLIPTTPTQTITFIPANINAVSNSGVDLNGSIGGESGSNSDDTPKKRRGRPPIKKPLFCAECGTTETPEWRRGENGPNTLCNGCGLRFAKRRKQEMESKKKHSIDILLNEKREALAKAAATSGSMLPVSLPLGLVPTQTTSSVVDETILALPPSPSHAQGPILDPTSLVMTNDIHSHLPPQDTTQILISPVPPSPLPSYPSSMNLNPAPI